ncbi:MAG: bifunctional phosphoglucose/phosphomannose isomerase [Candidatus Omnitrophota bacterium]
MASLDDLKLVEKYDKSDMLGTIELFPRQCLEAKSIGLSFNLPEAYRIPYRNIICTGLGGSAIGADILRSYLWNKIKIPLFVNRNYVLPAFADQDTLVVVCSYSGNTEETINAYRDAKKKGAKAVIATTGGILRKLAEKDGVPVIPIPKGLQPRCAIGYMAITVLILLSKIGILSSSLREIDETVEVLDNIRRKKAGFAVRENKNIAKKIARALYGKYPVIYASQDYMDCAVTRLRGELSENAKILSAGNSFPEMNHNEIEGWDGGKKIFRDFTAVILRDTFDHPQISRRMDITEKIISREGVRVIEVYSEGRSRLARIFSLVYIGDFISLYLAILNRTDPTPVERISEIKKNLKK